MHDDTSPQPTFPTLHLLQRLLTQQTFLVIVVLYFDIAQPIAM
jgi:hypothetical protein